MQIESSAVQSRIEEEIVVKSFDDVPLVGTLTLPNNEFNSGLLFVFVHGSFCQDRDGNFDTQSTWMFPMPPPKRNLFLDTSKHLSSLGVATFRYDKRASGQSGGSYQATDLTCLARDLIEVCKCLRLRFKDAVRIIVLGHSEGAQTAAVAESLGNVSDGVTFEAGMLVSLDELFTYQKERAAKAFLHPTPEIMRAFPYFVALYQNFANREFIQAVVSGKAERGVIVYEHLRFETNFAKYRQYENVNVISISKSIKKPKVFIGATNDTNCPIAPLLNLTEEQKASMSPVRIYLLDGLDHSFRRASDTTPLAVSMALPIDGAYLTAIEQVVVFFRDSLCR